MTFPKEKWDTNLIIGAIACVMLLMISSFFYKELLSILEAIISSPLMDLACILSIVTILIFHYFTNKNDDKNIVSDKEGLESAFNYFFYGGRILALLYGMKILLIISFFPDVYGCGDGLKDVNFIIIITVFVIGLYAFGILKPVIEDTFKNREKLKVKSDN